MHMWEKTRNNYSIKEKTMVGKIILQMILGGFTIVMVIFFYLLIKGAIKNYKEIPIILFLLFCIWAVGYGVYELSINLLPPSVLNFFR